MFTATKCALQSSIFIDFYLVLNRFQFGISILILSYIDIQCFFKAPLLNFFKRCYSNVSEIFPYSCNIQKDTVIFSFKQFL